VRLILPIRLSVRGGRSWVVTPDGSPILTKARTDRALIKGLQKAHRFVTVMHADGAAAKAPARAYDRQLSLIAFLAPDIQRAILEGRQTPGFNLERLVHGEIPLAWEDQRRMFGFGGAALAA
jgi:site-specific DNA recombinase